MGQSVGKHVRRKDLSQQNYTQVYFQDAFLFLPSFGINYFSAFCGNLVSVLVKLIFVSFSSSR